MVFWALPSRFFSHMLFSHAGNFWYYSHLIVHTPREGQAVRCIPDEKSGMPLPSLTQQYNAQVELQ